MCNFNKQSEDTKKSVHLFMKKCAEAIGGTNFLLGLIETMKSKKPNALMLKECKVSAEHADISWNKTIFKDKLEVLEGLLKEQKSSEDQDLNILKNQNDKKKKKIINMVRTLTPIEFTITSKDSTQKEKFTFKVFETIEDDNVTMNPVFTAMFFCSLDYTKKALKYEL